MVNKIVIYDEQLRNNKSSFYNYFLKTLIKNDDGILRNASVKIDGSGDAVFRRALQSYLRQELNPGQLRKLAFIDSKRDNLIQLADMVVGAIARSYKGQRYDAQRWKEMLAKQIDNIWDFKGVDVPYSSDY